MALSDVSERGAGCKDNDTTGQTKIYHKVTPLTFYSRLIISPTAAFMSGLMCASYTLSLCLFIFYRRHFVKYKVVPCQKVCLINQQPFERLCNLTWKTCNTSFNSETTDGTHELHDSYSHVINGKGRRSYILRVSRHDG